MGKSRGRHLGLLALRVGVGATLAAHGSQKLFGVLGGHGLDGTGAFMDSLGFRPDKVSALLAGLGEFGGGSLMALGLATPLGGAAGAATMVVAGSTHAENGFWNTNGGFELPATLATASTALALTGAGKYSVDHLLGDRLAPSWLATVALAGSFTAAGALIARASLERAADRTDTDEGGTTGTSEGDTSTDSAPQD